MAPPNRPSSAFRQVSFPSAFEFHAARTFPLVAKVAFVAAAFVGLFLVLDWWEGRDRPEFLALLGARMATLGTGLAGGLVAWLGRRPRPTLVGILLLGALSQNCATLAQVFLQRDLESILPVLTFYFLSFVLLAPLLSRMVTVVFLVLVATSMGLVIGLAPLAGVPTPPASVHRLSLFLLSSLAFIGLMMETLRRSAQEAYIHAHNDHLHLTLDSLSQLLNRATWLSRAEERWRRLQDQGQPCSLLMVDIDHFKSVNDTLGHAAGDQVIRAVAGALLDQTRVDDLVGRLGGEEFAILLPGLEITKATQVAERIRLAVQSLPAVEGRTVTVSQGAVGSPLLFESLDAQLRAADARLYEAKKTGRNRWVAGSPPSDPEPPAEQR